MNHRPDFLIIGAMKSATSTLHEQLGAQPGIFMSSPKEIYYFSDDEYYQKGMDWYLNHFAQADRDDLCGESSTHYTKLPTYPHTVDRIRSDLQGTKFIYVMRDPIDRLTSQYIHHWTMRETLGSFDQCLAETDILVAYSEYARQLHPYFEAFGKENVLPVFFDRLCKYPQAELERVCRFIGYDRHPEWMPELSGQNESAARLRTNPTRDAVLNAPVLSHLRRGLVPRNIRDRVKRLWQMQGRPSLSDAWRAKIVPRIDQDLRCLGDLMGIDLNCENFKSATSEPDSSPDWCDRPDMELVDSCIAISNSNVCGAGGDVI
tara:strand:+ start:129325 stop:130278 length:954 start_codon:yes stop_codon:yes gene_type:complete